MVLTVNNVLGIMSPIAPIMNIVTRNIDNGHTDTATYIQKNIPRPCRSLYNVHSDRLREHFESHVVWSNLLPSYLYVVTANPKDANTMYTAIHT